MINIESFFKDVNGDNSSKKLMGIAIGSIWVIFSSIAFFYSLGHEVKCVSTVESVLYSLGTYSAILLGITTFQRYQGNRNE